MSGTLSLSGTGLTRAILLRETGTFIEERRFTGSASFPLPRGLARIVVLGEGTGAWLRSGQLATPVGLDRRSTALSLGSGRYAGHGCLVEIRRRWRSGSWDPVLAVVRGAVLLEQARSIRVRCPGAATGTLVIRLRAAEVSPPSPLDHFKATMLCGSLGAASIQQVGAEVVLLAPITGTGGDWCLEVEVAQAWRLQGVILVPKTLSSTLAHVQARLPQDVLDDRVTLSDTAATRVSWEVRA